MEALCRQKRRKISKLRSKRKEKIVLCRLPSFRGKGRGSYQADDLTRAGQEILDCWV